MKKSILERALDPHELSVRFQPIVQIQGTERRLDSVEALIRGPRGTHFERADILFDYVRRKKAEAAVDQSCLTAICAAAQHLPSEVRINVNVHASTLGHNSSFVEFFHRHLREQSLAPERFTIELVEHAPSCHILELTTNIAVLREYGVRIALDDVGLGQSNYRMMLDCHPDYFKLDAYFVRDLSADSKRRAVVRSLAALAEALDSAVVAEGATSADDLLQLEEMGVPLAQANILCPALPLEDLLARGYMGVEAFDPSALKKSAKEQISACQPSRKVLSLAVGQSFYT
jgi:EAL domain-containing protein (putative c-di-GMP-specific phosphodiesterase class I)